MTKHIVLVKVRPDLAEAQLQLVFAELGGLKNSIAGIINFSWGALNSPEGLDRGYTHAFEIEFENAAARDAYLPHPEHQRVAGEVLLPALQDGVNSVLVFDYDC
jgi:hypothetical protein